LPSGLTRRARTYQYDWSTSPLTELFPGDVVTLGIPSHRAERKSKADLDALKKSYQAQKQGQQLSPEALDQVWNELKKPGNAIRALNIDRLPADALGFYRPFHFSPHEEWGIYLMIGPMLGYCETLYRTFKGKLTSFSLETLMGCLLFEVFHHEFFHHLTECAATTLEIASASFGLPRQIFGEYWDYRFDRTAGLGPHRHHPLEEALANAYAYNSFSFLSRTQIGFKLAWVKLYQKVLEQCWPQEPPGYRSAGEYINSGYVSGAAQLLAMLMASPDLDPASLMLLAKTVLPNGNSAFLQKPDVPTYLVGDAHVLQSLQKLIATPNETYTSLFWLGDTSSVDEYLKKRKEAEKKSRA